MTMSFSDLGRRDPRLRGFRGLPMIVGLKVREAYQDPFEEFWNDLSDVPLVDVAEGASTTSAARPEHAPEPRYGASPCLHGTQQHERKHGGHGSLCHADRAIPGW